MSIIDPEIAEIDQAVQLEIELAAKRVRTSILQSIHIAGTGHAGPSLSMVEILLCLYRGVMKVRPNQPSWQGRDRLVLSKGHGAPGLYAVMAEVGLIPKSELATLRRFRGRLQGHPSMEHLVGIEASTGSLGQGISIAVGMALGLKRKNSKARVFCILGDGELQEGQNWEAFMFAAQHGLTNLTAIVDRNGLQNDGPTEDIVSLEPIDLKLEAFGWDADVVDGHNIGQLLSSLRFQSTKKPRFIVANTVKGKGVSYMEGSVQWHHKPITDENLRVALSEIQT